MRRMKAPSIIGAEKECIMSRKTWGIFPLVGLIAIVLLKTPNLLCGQGQRILVDHSCTHIEQIPEAAVIRAKQNLHIAYGHTSHGSQLTTGMTGLVSFMNGKGYPANLYAWNNGGTGGALDLHDYAMAGDAGYYPAWVNNTRNYLGPPNPATGRGSLNADVNVIIWSWCGQVSSLSEQQMITNYLAPMSALENDYPGIEFVYMTGHLDGYGANGNLNLRNNQIRNYCRDNNKILYDFADIESYDPDGRTHYMPLMADDNCDYDSDGNGSRDRNWATVWQNSHTVNVDWYNCSAAHSQALNGNLKAYAAWWLWARLAGWDPSSSRKDDLLGTWAGDGVYYKNSETGTWVLMERSPASQIAAGDLDGDGTDDLIGTWAAEPGVWVKKSSTRTWAKLDSVTPTWIAAGDMNGDGRDDLLGSWAGVGVYYKNSVTGTWTRMESSPASQIAAGDLDGDGTDDLIGTWAAEPGVWVKKSSTRTWAKLDSVTPTWIAAGKMRASGNGNGFQIRRSYEDLSGSGPHGGTFRWTIEENARVGGSPDWERQRRMTPGPGEPGFKPSREKNSSCRKER